MSDLVWLTETQMCKIELYFPLSRGALRVDDRRIISGIVFVIRNGLRWRDAPRRIGRTKDGLNCKLQAVCDGKGRPLILLLSEGQMSDFGGAALMIDAFPKARSLLGDKGYDADWFREALATRKIEACSPSKSNRKIHIPHDTMLYRQRRKIEIMLGHLKDWRRIHTRYDRCAHIFMPAICIAATTIFWINQ